MATKNSSSRRECIASHGVSNVVQFAGADARATAAAFRQLAEAAERGELIGAGYVAITFDRFVHIGTLGYARRNPDMCLRGAYRLMDTLAYDSSLD